MTGSITIIGAGKVGASLARALYQSGLTVDLIISRSAESARSLARITNSSWSTSCREDISSDFVLLCVPDSVIESICRSLGDISSSIILHTAGTSTMESFASLDCMGHGVFYPLQTFTSGREVEISMVPFLIEGNSEKTEDTICSLAESISNSVFRVGAEDRKMLHLAAVFVSNFVNHMLMAGEQISSKTEYPFSILQPLIDETFSKARDIGPAPAQTGPAARNDQSTIEKQIDLLSFSPELLEIYRAVTRSIIKNTE